MSRSLRPPGRRSPGLEPLEGRRLLSADFGPFRPPVLIGSPISAAPDGPVRALDAPHEHGFRDLASSDATVPGPSHDLHAAGFAPDHLPHADRPSWGSGPDAGGPGLFAVNLPTFARPGGPPAVIVAESTAAASPPSTEAVVFALAYPVVNGRDLSPAPTPAAPPVIRVEPRLAPVRPGGNELRGLDEAASNPAPAVVVPLTVAAPAATPTAASTPAPAGPDVPAAPGTAPTGAIAVAVGDGGNPAPGRLLSTPAGAALPQHAPEAPATPAPAARAPRRALKPVPAAAPEVAQDVALEMPAPVGSDLITEFNPFDGEAIDESLGRLFDELDEMGVAVPERGDLLAYALPVALGLAAVEIARRRLGKRGLAPTIRPWGGPSASLSGLF